MHVTPESVTTEEFQLDITLPTATFHFTETITGPDVNGVTGGHIRVNGTMTPAGRRTNVFAYPTWTRERILEEEIETGLWLMWPRA
jgi:hypothetical protein